MENQNSSFQYWILLSGFFSQKRLGYGEEIAGESIVIVTDPFFISLYESGGASGTGRTGNADVPDTELSRIIEQIQESCAYIRRHGKKPWVAEMVDQQNAACLASISGGDCDRRLCRKRKSFGKRTVRLVIPASRRRGC